MAKQNKKIEALKKAGQKAQKEFSAKENESNIRVERLSQTIFQGINTALNEDEFTHYEITDAVLRVAHHYNKRALEHQNSLK